MNLERLHWIDRMRGLAILSVVIQHLVIYNTHNTYVFHHLIGISNMAVFFFISGYILNQTTWIVNAKETGLFILKKNGTINNTIFDMASYNS